MIQKYRFRDWFARYSKQNIPILYPIFPVFFIVNLSWSLQERFYCIRFGINGEEALTDYANNDLSSTFHIIFNIRTTDTNIDTSFLNWYSLCESIK